MYLIYDCSKSSPFALATKNVLKHLDIPFSTLDNKKSFKIHGGHFGRIGALENFLFANVYNIALAANTQSILLALEEDSYANLMHTIKIVQNNTVLKDFLSKELEDNNILIDLDLLQQYVAYFPTILGDYIDKIKQNIKHSFGTEKDSKQDVMPLIMPDATTSSGFSTCIFYGSRHADCNEHGEYKRLREIFNLLGLRLLETHTSTQSFTHLLPIDAEQAYEKSGGLLFSGIDLGVDFLCVCADSTFEMFDKQQSSCIKYSGRDPIHIASLNIAQILLIAFGKMEEAGFNLHSFNPQLIFSSNSAV